MKKIYILIAVIIVLLLIALVIFKISSNDDIDINIKDNDDEIVGENLYSIKFNELISDENKKLDVIEDLIKKNFDNKFDINNYEVVENSYVNDKQYNNIDLTYKINDIYTNLGYYITIENNVITEILTNTKNVDVSKYMEEISVFDQDFSLYKDDARIPLDLKDNVVIKDQKIKKMYDLFENVKQIVILTTYEENGEEKVSDYKVVL